jgi:hypothetical protein
MSHEEGGGDLSVIGVVVIEHESSGKKTDNTRELETL